MDTRAPPRGNCLMAIRELDGRYAGAPVELPVARQIFRSVPERAVVKRIHSHAAVISPIAIKTFGLLPGAMRGLPFDRKVEALLLDRADVALIVRPMLVAWRQLREQIAAFDKAIRVLVKSNGACRLLMSVRVARMLFACGTVPFKNCLF